MRDSEKKKEQESDGSRGGARVPPYFYTKLRPEGPKKIFLSFMETAPTPPFLRVWMTGLNP